MKVQQIAPAQAFEAKQRYISQTAKDNIKELLTKMNAETEIEIRYYTFTSTITKSLADKEGKSKLIDGRMLFQRIREKKQMVKQTMLDIGKTQLVIDNKTGEIIDYAKSFFTSWGRILKKVDKFTKFFLDNYDNPDKVKKERLSIEGLTQRGADVIECAKRQREIVRLSGKTRGKRK